MTDKIYDIVLTLSSEEEEIIHPNMANVKDMETNITHPIIESQLELESVDGDDTIVHLDPGNKVRSKN